MTVTFMLTNKPPRMKVQR